ncbi:MAG TPA: hypothetical protein VFV20_07045 [Candidatus Limnocylindria bacterium]|nr:hypothetical protein [Candidatus Limnocylindria bacterium]
MRTLSVTVAALLLAGCVARGEGPLTSMSPSPATVQATASLPPAAATATAAPSAATAVPLVTPTPRPTPAPVPSCPVAPRPVGDIALVALCPEGAELRIAASLSADDRAAIAAQVTADLVAVQSEFAWRLRTPAVVYVLADRDGYVAALQRVFGYGAATAEFLADNSVAFFEPSLRIIAVDWEEVRDRRPIAAIRHELTHVVTLEACAPRCDLVPAWLNEGQARLAEALMPGSEWRLMRVRYEAASMRATGTLLPLTALWTQAQWNALADWIGYYKYQEAARATELLREDIGDGAIARLYARIRAGQDVPTAYAALAGQSFASFTATLDERIGRGADAERGIVAITPGAEGGGASFLVYGFPAEATITVHVRAHGIDERSEVKVSPQGAWFGGIDATRPRGAYTITAASGDAVAAVTISKSDGRPLREAPFD